MGLLSSETVQQEIATLRGEGVTVNGRPERFAPRAPLGWILGKHAECSLAEIVGERVGYENVVLDADRAGDVDVLVKADHDYCIQVKSLNFVESKHFGKQITDDLRRVSENVVEATPQNIAYRGGFTEQKRLNVWNIPTETANVGHIQFQPSYFGWWNIRKKMHGQLRKASKQLRYDNEPGRRNIAAIDARYFHAVGDRTYHDIMLNLFDIDESLATIDHGLIISFDLFPEDGGHQAGSRLVPVHNPHSDQEINMAVFADPPVQLYKARPFALPVKMHMEKGWNTVLQIEEGMLKVEDTPIMPLF